LNQLEDYLVGLAQRLRDNVEFDASAVAVELCKCFILGRNQDSFSSFSNKDMTETCKQFGLEVIYAEPLVTPLDVPNELTKTLETIDQHVNMKNEAASRVVIDSVMLTALAPLESKVMFTEHPLRATIDGREYSGFADYLFASCVGSPKSVNKLKELLCQGMASPDMMSSLITEATRFGGDLGGACSQLIVEMLAARGASKNIVHGTATDGDKWIFLVLQGKKLFHLCHLKRSTDMGMILAMLGDHLASKSTYLPVSPTRPLRLRAGPADAGMTTPRAQTAAAKAAAKAAVKVAAKRKTAPKSPEVKKKKGKKPAPIMSPPVNRKFQRR